MTISMPLIPFTDSIMPDLNMLRSISRIPDNKSYRVSVNTGCHSVLISDLSIIVDEVICLLPVKIPNLLISGIIRISILQQIICCTSREIRKLSELQHLYSDFLSKTYYSISFLKPQRHVESDAVRVAKLTITGKLCTSFFFCPFLAF